MPRALPIRTSTVIALCAGVLFAGCVRDADTVLEPDPSAEAGPADGGLGPDAAAAPRIEIDPPMVALDGAGSVAELTIRSVGDAPLTLQRIARNGAPGFAVLVDGRNALIAGPGELTGPEGLAPGASLVLEVEALVGPPAAAALVFVSDDPVRPEVEVAVGFPDAPCLRADPEAVDFGDVAPGMSAMRAARILNCGGRAIELRSIALGDETDAQYELPEAPGLEALAAGGFVDVLVRYTARVDGPARGTLHVDADGAALRIPLTARSRAGSCPVAQAAASELRAEAQDVVVLDGSSSVDPDGPDGRPIHYQWTVIARPEGSTAQLVESYADPADPSRGGRDDDAQTPRALMWLDRPGHYAFELAVMDAGGCVDRQQVAVEACPCADDGFVVELAWETPGVDPAEGAGADLDLHLLHPLGEAWFSRPYDCHYAEPTPDWGQIDNPVDDPVLDVDRVGVGPERIRLVRPENTETLGAPYIVGVHHNGLRPDGGAPPVQSVEAVVRVFVAGVMTDERAARLEPDFFWDVVGLHWPDGAVVVRDRLYEQRP